MNENLKFLLLEDEPEDAELAERALKSAGYQFTSRRVVDRGGFLDALNNFRPDVVLVDYKLPLYDGLSALKLTLERSPGVPVIVVTGTISEERAAECIKLGASDFVLKTHLSRLGPGVANALRLKRDRDARLRAEFALRQSEERFRSVAESAGDAIVTAGTDGRITFWNPAAERIFGYPLEETLGRSLTMIMPERFRSAHNLGVERFLATGEARVLGQALELTGLRKDGTEFPLEISLSEWKAGGMESFSAIIRDVTGRHSLESQLRQAQKMEAIGQLTGGIAHDFNNLLSVILLNTQAVADACREKAPETIADLEDVEAAARRAAAMTKQLLGFSRRTDLSPVATDLPVLITNLRSMLQRVLPVDINLRVRAEQPTRAALADPGAVEQAVLNLVNNARDAMPNGGDLVIEVRETELDGVALKVHAHLTPGAYVCLSVTDTGAGMDEATKVRVFEPFFTTKGPETGTGLGLAMVYGLTKQQGGHVLVDSEPGEGTTVRLFFPVTEEQAPVSTRHSLETTTVRGGTETILLVEDEETLRGAGRRVLERFGYTVIPAADGEEALEIWRARCNEIDLVLSDMSMPRMNGAELYRRLSEEPNTPRFILATGNQGRAVRGERPIDPTVPLLRKPWEIDELLLGVRRVLDATAGPPKRSADE